MIKHKTSIKNKSISKISPWSVTTNRFVGYIDIMGFKDMITRERHADIHAMMKKVSGVLQFTKGILSHSGRNIQFLGLLPPKINHLRIRTMTYSDSIIIYSKDSSKESAEHFILALSFIIETMFLNRIPFKGAVAHGKMTLDESNSIFFGKPLIDAILLSEELAFYGIVVHGTAEFQRNFKFPMLLSNYNCPLKKGTATHLTISPLVLINNAHNKVDYKILRKEINLLNIRTSGSLRQYVDNTIKYVDAIFDKINSLPPS